MSGASGTNNGGPVRNRGVHSFGAAGFKNWNDMDVATSEDCPFEPVRSPCIASVILGIKGRFRIELARRPTVAVDMENLREITFDG